MGHFAPKPYGAAHARAREMMIRGSSNAVAARRLNYCYESFVIADLQDSCFGRIFSIHLEYVRVCVTSKEIIVSLRVVSNIEFETFFQYSCYVEFEIFSFPGGKSASLGAAHILKSLHVSGHVPRSILEISNTSVRGLLERKALSRRLL